MRKRLHIVTALSLVMILMSACAIKKEACIGCSNETLWLLNIGAELQSDQNLYKQFFKDVGDARRQGLLTQGQMLTLNSTGDKLKSSLDEAAQVYKAYSVAPSADKKQKIVNLLLEASRLLTQLTTARTQMSVKAGGTN